ncbi:MAG: hypothetical protein HY664_05265 [Chloroflexi bacterium]|nr:hypothetical protein [Chloroflexota bacterium]
MLYKQGKPLKEIRVFIEAKYSKGYGPGTNTPQPPS